jgi:branched-chain amino acid transport system substrate-binding protein
MTGFNRRHVPGRLPLTAVAAAGLLALSACGGSVGGGGPAAADSLPDTIKVVSINPETGVVGFAGTAANQGYELAIKEINESDFLEGTQIEIDYVDTKSEPQTAAQEFTKVTSAGDVSAVFGSVSSNEAVAMSPLAEKQKMPIIYTQAGSEGVVVGDYTWRATPLMSEYFPLSEDFIKDTGAKSIGIIYTEATPTLQEIGTKTVPDIADELGLEVVANVGTQATTQDFQAPINQVLDEDPDLVSVLLVGAQNPTAMTQLREAGYDGPVLGNSGASTGNLDPAAEAGEGMVWPADFNAGMSAESSQEFVAAFEEEFGEKPTNYAAEAYDAAWFLAKALKESQSPDRESIQDAMEVVAEEPFDGALGEGITWEDQDLVVPGVMVEYTTDGEKVLYEGQPAE